MAGTIAVQPYFTVLDTSGDPVAGALVTTYEAGTVVPATTYQDANLAVPNANPVVCDGAGRCVIFLRSGQSYKFVITTAAGAAIKTVDGVQATPESASNLDVLGTAGEALSAGEAVYLSDGWGVTTAGKWYKADSDSPYSSTLPVVGMVQNAIAADAIGTVRLAGKITGLAGLTVGYSYYIGPTAGQIQVANPYTNARIIGAADSATSVLLQPASVVRHPATVVTVTDVGVKNDWAITGLSNDTIVRCNNATDLTIQGISPLLQTGARLTLMSVGAGNVILAHENAGSVAGARLINAATVGTTVLAAGKGRAEYVYDGTSSRWRLVTHQQGAPITPAFNAGDFTASGGMTWTVAAGDVATYSYTLRDKRLVVDFTLNTTSTGGVASGNLNIAIPNGYTAVKAVYSASVFIGDKAVTQTLGNVSVAAGGAVIVVARGDGGNFDATSADQTYVRGSLEFEVT